MAERKLTKEEKIFLKLEPTRKEELEARQKLVEYFASQKGKKGRVTQTVNRIIAKAKRGYPNCPSSFLDRVMDVSGINKKIKKKVEKPYRAPSSTEDKETFQKELFTHFTNQQLSRVEINWTKRRIDYYLDEFEFNMSSDFPLLISLLTDELILKRYETNRLDENAKVNEKSITDIQNRIVATQKTLGITRYQRKDELKDRAGDIASLSVNLDQKLAKIESIDAYQRQQEEEHYQTSQLRDEPKNIIPDLDEIKKLSKAVDDSDIQKLADDIEDSEDEQDETD